MENIKDVNNKTEIELRNLREGNTHRERTRKSKFDRVVEAVDLGTTSYDNRKLTIHKKRTYNFERGIAWSMWTKDIADYAHRNAVTLCLTEEIRNFIERLANAIEREEPYFKCQLMLVGSAFEGTKIDSPDEFDFDFILTKFSDLFEVIPSPIAPDGFVHLRKKSGITLEENEEKRFFDKEGILKTTEINCRFHIILSKVLRDPSFWKDEPWFELADYEDKMKKFGRCYDRHKNGGDQSDLTDKRPYECICFNGICTTVRLKQTRSIEGNYLPNDISLDLVPCIHVDGWWPEKARSDISDTLKADGCNLVFDEPRRKYVWVPYGENYARISFAPAESKMIRKSSPTAKAAYMVCKHLIKNKPQMTYILKTCLLYCIEALGVENERPLDDDEETDYSTVAPENLSLWVEKLMRCYLMFVLQDFCPCYLMPSFCLPIGEFLRTNHILLHVTDQNNYDFLKKEKQGSYDRVREVYTDSLDFFRRVCTSRSTVIHLPKPQPLWEDFSRIDLISALRKES